MTTAAHHSSERRTHRRGRLSVLADPLFKGFRVALGHVHSFRAAVGVFVLAGATVALGGAALFAEFAGEVREGDTQVFDERVLQWIGQNQNEMYERAMVEITMLGTGIVVLTMVGVSAMFLWLSRHRYSAILLLVATAGGIVLNNILKLSFARPRPQVFEWGAHALSSSFPSGHAMSAAIVYGTVAYLAARLQQRRWTRALTMLVALGLILLISFSRLYLGVHYPSDVAAGMVIGLAWAGFCMATLEVIQRYAVRGSPQVVQDELPAPEAQEEGAAVGG